MFSSWCTQISTILMVSHWAEESFAETKCRSLAPVYQTQYIRLLFVWRRKLVASHFSFRYVNCVTMKAKKPREEGRKYANKTMDMAWPLRSYYTGLWVQKSQMPFGWPKQKHTNIWNEKYSFLFVGFIGFLFSIHCTKDKCIWPFFKKKVCFESASTGQPALVYWTQLNNRRWIPCDNTFYYTYWKSIRQW